MHYWNEFGYNIVKVERTKVELHWRAFDKGDLFNGKELGYGLDNKTYQVTSVTKKDSTSYVYTFEEVLR